MAKVVEIAELAIGGDNPIRVESMLKRPLSDRLLCLEDLNRLSESGCELVRVAFPKADLKDDLSQVVKESPLPLMADIHFDPKLAEIAINSGCPAIRINPGNMGSPEKLSRIIDMAKERNVVIRIGANSGSVSPRQVKEAGGDRAAGLALAVEEQLKQLLDNNFENLIISAKSIDVRETIKANEILYSRYPEYPFHVGITEPGTGIAGIAKSAVGLGIMLSKGIGNTLRVSLSDDPAKEVKTGYEILRSLDLRQRGAEVISCPTCGRKQLDVVKILPEIEDVISKLPDGVKIAIMGCEVNGPQEAKHADLGVAGSPSGLVIFKKGEIIDRCSLSELHDKLSLLTNSFVIKSQ